MADIELVVKLPEGLKNDFEAEQWTALSCMEMKDALMNSTPLPKGHGRLIDADKVITKATELIKHPTSNQYMECVIMECVIAHTKLAPTIIEADNAEGEE